MGLQSVLAIGSAAVALSSVLAQPAGAQQVKGRVSSSQGADAGDGHCWAGSCGVQAAQAASLLQRASSCRGAKLVGGEGLGLKTVGWRPEDLLGVRELLRGESPPSWASVAKDALVSQARRVVSLPSGLRPGVPAGPWSPVQKSTVPPSRDKRDYSTIGGYYWPCTATCEDTGYSVEQCQAWETGLRTFGPCDTATGLPWVARDGFLNSVGQEDLNALIVMADTVETLTLAWWFSVESEESTKFAKTAARAIRAWFIDEETRQNPRMEFASAIPGYLNGSAGGVIAPTFRLNSRLSDCIELLRTAGAEVWSEADTASWQQWATAWYTWLQTSEFGKIELGAVGNHATFLFIHKLALASTTGNASAILEQVKTLRTGLAGSLAEQILPSGEMPVETARTSSTTYTRMNLEGLFKLGVVAETVCQGLDCSPAWDWSWKATGESSQGWEKYANTISYCAYRGLGSTESVEQCQASCLASPEACNGVVTRHLSSGLLYACYFKECQGEVYDLREASPGSSIYDSYMYVTSHPAGSGSVKRALDFALPYALHDKSWVEDFPHSMDADDSWKTLALPLRIAAVAFKSSHYEESIASVDPDGSFQRSAGALLFPPTDALAA